MPDRGSQRPHRLGVVVDVSGRDLVPGGRGEHGPSRRTLGEPNRYAQPWRHPVGLVGFHAVDDDGGITGLDGEGCCQSGAGVQFFEGAPDQWTLLHRTEGGGRDAYEGRPHRVETATQRLGVAHGSERAKQPMRGRLGHAELGGEVAEALWGAAHGQLADQRERLLNGTPGKRYGLSLVHGGNLPSFRNTEWGLHLTERTAMLGPSCFRHRRTRGSTGRTAVGETWVQAHRRRTAASRGVRPFAWPVWRSQP